jgi:DNA-binding Lrp family transcriptional regulator
MFINKDIHENDKIILNKLGKNADIPVSELLTLTHYRRKSSVYNRIRNLRREKYLYGPYFDIDYNAIGTNKLYTVLIFAEYNTVYKDVVLEAMRAINCFTMIYPVRTAKIYIGVYRCNNWNYVASLFHLMKKWGWLTDYSVHKTECRWIMQNPNFFGDFIPPPDYQTPKGTVPHYQYDSQEVDIEFTKIDLVVLKHLSRKTCHLTEIRDIEYQYYGLKLKYHDLKRSYQKLSQGNILLKKNYTIFPLPVDGCSLFFLMSKGKNFRSHLEMTAHFGTDLRLTKLFIAVGRGVISYFSAHPLLEAKILGIVEDHVQSADVYGIKTYPTSELSTKTFNDDYFDVFSQRWVFPYSTFKEKIKILKEENEKKEM